LATSEGFHVVSSDRVRKELAGVAPETPARAAFGAGIYTPEWNDRTYAECLVRAKALLYEGKRVIVDASFRERERRRAFRDAAVDCGVRSLLLVCSAEANVIRARLAERRGSASDADWSIHVAAARAWEQRGCEDSDWERTVPTGGTRAESMAAAVDQLRTVGLAP
jgi:predicted kinase